MRTGRTRSRCTRRPRGTGSDRRRRSPARSCFRDYRWSAMAFDGFAPAALRFLRDLGENNSREWFQAHRDDYDTLLLEPARDFVVAMGEELRAIGADVHA